MGGRRKLIDWDLWKRRFIEGDDSITLVSLSELPGAPAYQTLKNKAYPKKDSLEPSWNDLRARYRKELLRAGVISSTADIKPNVQRAIDKTESIIDAARMLEEHNALAYSLLAKASEGLMNLDGKKLKPNEIATFTKLGIDIQRTIEGMATQKTEVDFRGMSDAELDKIIDGDA